MKFELKDICFFDYMNNGYLNYKTDAGRVPGNK